jgi:hypothetical protein
MKTVRKVQHDHSIDFKIGADEVAEIYNVHKLFEYWALVTPNSVALSSIPSFSGVAFS